MDIKTIFINIFTYGLWLLLCIPVFIFVYVIAALFLFAPPTEWVANTDNLLPGLGDLYIPAFGMYIHFIGGITIMICGLIQILPLSRKYINFHRIIGNIYVIFSVITGIGGNIFIYTNGTVGGINMDIAFSLFGWLMIIYALITYVYARNKNIKKHKNWAIRSWSLCYSSLFYRLLYIFIGIFGYSVVSSDDFKRPFDECIDWIFFLLPLLIAEIYIQRNIIKLCITVSYYNLKKKSNYIQI